MKTSIWLACGSMALVGVPAYFISTDDRIPTEAAAGAGQLRTQSTSVAAAMPYFSHVAPNPAETVKESKAAEIDRLSASGNPADAYKAFQLAFSCQSVRRNRRTWRDDFNDSLEQTLCGDIGELQFRQIAQNLDKAVTADIPQALIGKFYYGPDGDLYAMQQRPNDPDVLAWRKELLRELTGYLERTGDPATMIDMANFYSGGTLGIKDPMLAYGYRLAEEQLSLKSADPRLRRMAIQQPAARSELARGLTPEQIAGANAFAAYFVTNCCKRR